MVTVCLCATLPFQALLLQMRTVETPVTEGLATCKSSPPSHTLRQEDRTLWDSACSPADLTKFISIVIISAASSFACRQGFFSFLGYLLLKFLMPLNFILVTSSSIHWIILNLRLCSNELSSFTVGSLPPVLSRYSLADLISDHRSA